MRLFAFLFVALALLAVLAAAVPVYAGSDVALSQTKTQNNNTGACTVGVTGQYVLPSVTVGADRLIVIQVSYSTFQGVTKPTWAVSDTLLNVWTIEANLYQTSGNLGMLVAVTLSAGGADVPTISWSGLASNDCPSAMTILTTWTNVKSDAIVVASANVQNSVSSSAT